MTIPVTAITGKTWIAAGNLPRYDGPHAPLLGFEIDRTRFPTRWAEYGFVLESLATDVWAGPILDAGTGFNPEIHVLSNFLGALNLPTVALDREPSTIALGDYPSVTRIIGDLCSLPQRNGTMGVYLNISVLEHLAADQCRRAWEEAYRVLRPGGTVIVTADVEDPRTLTGMANAVGFVTGPVVTLNGPVMTPPVSWIRAVKATEPEAA